VRPVLPALALSFVLAGVIFAQNQTPPKTPTWSDEIAKGFAPYRQLTVDDFPVNDHAHTEGAFWVQPFLHPHYHYYLKPNLGGYVYAYVSDWVVFSGINQNECSRKSSFHDMKAQLPFAQALIDINELHARELATLMAGDLPRGRGENFPAARADLDDKMKAFCSDKFDKIQTEMNAFANATNHGQDKKKVRELAAAIKKQLDAVPIPSPGAGTSSILPIPSATVAATASPVSK
jgi:hypothetical protein